MKILVVSQYYYPEQFRINEICAELVSRGNEVTVMTGLPNYPDGVIFEGYEKKFDDEKDGVHIVRCRVRPRKTGTLNLGLNYVSFMVNACRTIKRLKTDFDIVIVYQLSPILMAIPAIQYKKKYKIPLYIYCLDIWPESIRDVFKSNTSLLYRFVKKISARIYQKADFIGVTSKPFVSYLESICGVDLNKLHYLPQHAEDMMQLGNLTTINNNIVDFVFMGNVGHAQDLKNVVRAVKMVDTDKLFKVHIVGTGSEIHNLKEMVSTLGIEDKFVFHGRHSISEMPRFYRLADVCLLTLIKESNIAMTIPGKLQGYMSAAKPILAAVNGASAELIETSECGIRVPAGNAESLAKAITYFVENIESCEKYSINARRYFEEYFSIEKFIDSLMQYLNQLVEKKD